MAAPLTLRTRFRRAPEPGGTGTVDLELTSPEALADGWRLALTSVVPLDPPDGTRLVRRVSTYHELAPAPGETAHPRWAVRGIAAGLRAKHANDGPVAAFVVLRDGSTVDVAVEPMELDGWVAPRAAHGRERSPAPAGPPLVPFPRQVVVHDPTGHRRTLRLANGPRVARDAWSAVAALARRLGTHGSLVDDGDVAIDAALDDRLGPAASRVSIDGDRATVAAADPDGFRHAFVTLAQWAPTGLPARADVDDGPTWTWRGLHVDLARRWFEPATVERIVDLAAWRKLDRLHLHLTDDEGWRLPVAAWPELGRVGGTRGHGHPIPPMLGSGAAPYGRAYEPHEIARWVGRARELGVVLVPEVDLPAHCHAALTARPDLRDADDTSGAVSVQHFVDNVLVPGLPATTSFLGAVVDALVELFPDSPWLHLGGDEVPHGAWAGSPVVARFATERSLTGARAVEAAFHRDLVAMVHARGRRVGAWQEAAESGGVRPGDGYVVGWTSAAVARDLAAAGHDVVVSPGEAYYLDMAADRDWDAPGASWAGTVTFEDVCAFDPGAGWDDDERRHLLGVQACLWSEHVADAGTFDALVFPRLDAVAERAWTGRIEGAAPSLRARSAALPRLTTRQVGVG